MDPAPTSNAVPDGQPALPVPQIPIGRYRLEFQARQAVHLPDFAGSTWRGAFGHALKGTVCVTREKECRRCLLYRSCPYPYVFETPPPLDTGKMRRYTAAPHPFILEVPAHSGGELPPGQAWPLGITLVGRANPVLPYIVHSFERAGRSGVGRGRGVLDLAAVAQDVTTVEGDWQTVYLAGEALEPRPVHPQVIPPAPQGLALHFITPLRLKRDGRNVDPRSLRFADLFGNLLRRVSMLTYFHTETPLETDFAGLNQEARGVEWLETDLAWRDWTRYSSRQDRPVKMGGIVGHARLSLAGHPNLWPYLWLGQWLHAGHGTSMGMGEYHLDLRAEME